MQSVPFHFPYHHAMPERPKRPKSRNPSNFSNRALVQYHLEECFLMCFLVAANDFRSPAQRTQEAQCESNLWEVINASRETLRWAVVLCFCWEHFRKQLPLKCGIALSFGNGKLLSVWWAVARNVSQSGGLLVPAGKARPMSCVSC